MIPKKAKIADRSKCACVCMWVDLIGKQKNKARHTLYSIVHLFDWMMFILPIWYFMMIYAFVLNVKNDVNSRIETTVRKLYFMIRLCVYSVVYSLPSPHTVLSSKVIGIFSHTFECVCVCNKLFISMNT